MKQLSYLLLTAASLLLSACGDDGSGRYELTDGIPTVHYVRLPDAGEADSVLTGAYMGETVCLVGENLTSVRELYFNDVKALLNINFITKNTLLVTVPRGFPAEVIDKIVMVVKSGERVEYGFTVIIPAPEVTGIKCEQTPEGGEAVLYGDYFLDNSPTKRLTVTIGNYEVPAEDMLEVQKTQITFRSPAMDVKGAITVTSAHGNSRPGGFIFHDDRGILFDFDAHPIRPGWGRPNLIETGPDAIAGNYMKFRGNLDAGEWVTPSDNWQCNFWGEENGVPTGNLFSGDPATSVLKFEVNVLQAWSALPMQIFFAEQGACETPLWEDGPRAQWVPWKETGGAYTTDGWVTVSIPLANFSLDGKGEDLGQIPAHFGSMNIYIFNRGRADAVGTACDPVILIDNVRVVPGDA
ncbi:MAG: glycan-binding surface protein [Proteiniphilum sp.]|nr:glycan-binding surface protein [Proteiniphilum sp.]